MSMLDNSRLFSRKPANTKKPLSAELAYERLRNAKKLLASEKKKSATPTKRKLTDSELKIYYQRILNKLPDFLKKAEKDPAFLLKMRNKDHETLWKKILTHPELHFPPPMIAILNPDRLAFNILADEYYHYCQYTNAYRSATHLERAIAALHFSLLHLMGSQKETVITKLNLACDALNVLHSNQLDSTTKTLIKNILNHYETIDINTLDTLQSTLINDLETLKNLRTKNTPQLKKNLDTAIQVSQGFLSMAMRCWLDIEEINSATLLCTFEPESLDIDAIRRRALTICKQGAAGLVVYASVYHQLAYYYLLKATHTDLKPKTSLEAQRLVNKYARLALKAINNALIIHKQPTQKLRLENLAFNIQAWSGLNVHSFEDLQKELQFSLQDCLKIAEKKLLRSD